MDHQTSARHDGFDQQVISIQVLRAVAAWSVVFHHYMQVFFNYQSGNPVSSFFSLYGQLGVEIFFIISGFVMYHTLHWRPVGGVSFAVGRILRIVPAYWFATIVLIFVAAVGLADPTSRFTIWNSETLLYSLLFVPHEHPAGVGIRPVLNVGWTLNFEMFFYALLAIYLCISKRHTIFVAGVTLAVLPFFAVSSWPLGTILSSYLLFLFLVGIILYKLYLMRVFSALGPIPNVIIALSIIAISLVYMRLSGPAFRIVTPAGIVFGALFMETALRSWSVRVVRFLCHLGDLSYSSYLFHQIVLICLLHMTGVPQTFLAAIGALLATITFTYLVSLISYRFIEKPTVRLGKTFT